MADTRIFEGSRFQITGELGRGAMAVVYRALDTQSGVEVALKLLQRLDPRGVQRFEREAQIASSLDHPGIVRLIASGVQKGQPFIAYELVPRGNELGPALQHAGLMRRMELVRDTARALGHAHACGVVHRDVKPANVLVDMAGQVRVTDFGLARGTGVERLTVSGSMLGTPSHMAPEQVRGLRDQIGPPADVWALGVILYEALTGTCPFSGTTMTEVMSAILSASAVSPHRVSADVPPALERVCLRALRAEPADRYPDAGAMADALGEAIQSLRQERRPRPRPGVAVLVPALVLVAGLAAAVGIVARSARTPPRHASSTDPPISPVTVVPSPQAEPEGAGDAQDPLRAAAEAGDPRAMGRLGAWLITDGGEDRWSEGVMWLRRASDAGELDAQVNLGVAYEQGQGVSEDVEQAIGLYREAAAKGHAVAAFCLGTCLAKHGGDTDEAIAWLEVAAERGQRRAFNNLFALVLTAKGDRRQASEWARRGAEAGDATCMANWGYALYEGLGVERDRSAGAEWYRRSAEGGDRTGMNNWASVLERGVVVPQDMPAAVSWYSRALEAGHKSCFIPLVRRLTRGGPGLEPDYPEAVRWARLGEERGWKGSTLALGMLYLHGWGLPQDAEEAQRRLELASQRGSPTAMYELGMALISGDLLARDARRGRELVERAAELGLLDAQDALERGLDSD